MAAAPDALVEALALATASDIVPPSAAFVPLLLETAVVARTKSAKKSWQTGSKSTCQAEKIVDEAEKWLDDVIS